ncbi:MAG: peptidoglycan DD-metalloendopeptidase family protein, partial [Nitriliruptoraceae bacterium]
GRRQRLSTVVHRQRLSTVADRRQRLSTFVHRRQHLAKISIVALLIGSLAVTLVLADGAGLARAAHAVDQSTLDRAQQDVDDLGDELDSALEAYETTLAYIEETRRELAALQRDARQLEVDAARSERLLSARARAVFIQGSTATFETLLATGTTGTAVERAAMISTLQLREGARLEDAVASRVALEQVRALVEDREQQLDELQEQLDREAEVLQARLLQAEGRARTISTIVSRQRNVSRGSQQGVYACIFDNAFRFRDTWGAPRSGGRRHRGTDVMAPHNHPVYSFTAGVVRRSSRSGLGGLGLYIRGDDGNVYFYAHLTSVASGIVPGRRVSAGELVAYNGSTGNASPSAPHVHFEIHPGGGAAINPYQWLAAACF